MLDLFAGIGGFSLAGHWAGWQTAAFVEWDKFCQKVLAKNFPNVPIYGDIKDFHYEQEREKIGPIDLVCGGFPCQPFSHAGKRNGTADDRYLWPEMLRVIGEVKPSWVVGENVAGLLSMDGGVVFEEICASLEAEGYAIEAFVLPAISKGAPHRRDRVWIIANSNLHEYRANGGQISKEDGLPQLDRAKQFRNRGISGTDQVHGFTADARECGLRWPRGVCNIRKLDGGQSQEGETNRLDASNQICRPLVGNPNKPRLEGHGGYDQRHGEWFVGATGGEFIANPESGGRREGQGRAEWPHPDAWESDRGGQWREHWYEVATRLCRVHDGLSRGVDRNKRLKALGNAIVPQIAFEIFKAINETNI